MTPPRPHGQPADRRAFSLVELLLSIALVALLAGLILPALEGTLARAESIRCAGNLRQIGVSVNLYLGEHQFTYPRVEPDPTSPIYPPETGAKGILETFGGYGVTSEVLRCPADAKGPNHHARTGSSYEWRPMLDGEPSTNPILYTRAGAIAVSPSRVRQAIDFTPLHNGRMNALYGDGRVKWY